MTKITRIADQRQRLIFSSEQFLDFQNIEHDQTFRMQL